MGGVVFFIFINCISIVITNFYIRTMNYLYFKYKSDSYRVIAYFVFMGWVFFSAVVLYKFRFNFIYPDLLCISPFAVTMTYYILHGNVPGITKLDKDRDVN